MFRKLKIKIIATIMSILLTVFVGTLVVIYAASYHDIINEHFNMMETYGEAYEKGGVHAPAKPNGNHKNREETYVLTTFYSVELANNGSINKVVNEESSGLSDEELTVLASDLAASRSHYGSVDHMLYLVTPINQGTLVIFLNNIITSDNFTALFRYALIFGCCAIVILFFFSCYLADRMIRPLEISFARQKQFISDAGHELKTPLSVVSANAEILAREVGENKWLNNIRYENGKMAGLVSQLMQLARAESSQPVFSEFDLSKTITGYALPFESIAFEKNIKLTFAIAEGISAYGNEVQLGQVATILIDNAISHTAAEGAIKVELKRSRGTAILQVANTGEAIPADKREKIFERFYRLDKARSRESNHYGLGLSIAKAIITEHKGKISVDCANGWTTFTVTLPVRNQ